MPEVPQSLEQAPVPAPVPEKIPTPEEIKALADANEQEWFGTPASKKKEEAPAPVVEAKPEEKAPDKQIDKPKLATEEVDPSAPPPTPASPATKPILDEDELVDRVAERLGEKLKPAPAKKEDGPLADPFSVYGPKEKTQLETLEFISKNDPRFKGRDLAKETLKFWDAESRYIRKWQTDNSGERFDAASPDHQDFYRRNEPAGVSRDDLDDARVRMEVAKETKKIEEKFERRAKKEIDDRLAPIERDRLVQEKAPAIKQAINQSVTDLVTAVLPDMIGEGGLTPEVIKKIEEEDPIAMELLSDESAALNARVRELEAMRHLGQHFQFNKEFSVKVGTQRVTPHADIVDTAMELEEMIMSKPEADRVADGKRFMTRAERTDRIQNLLRSDLSPEEKNRRFDSIYDKYWTIELDDIRAAFVAKAAANVNRTLNMAKRRSKHSEERSARSGGSVAVSNGSSTPSGSSNRVPVTSGGVSEMVNTKVPGAGAQLSQEEINRRAWFE